MLIDLTTETNEKIKHPLIFVPDIFGSAGTFYKIAEQLQKFDLTRPIFAFHAPFLDSNSTKINLDSIEKVATQFVDELLRTHDSPGYFLCGYSMGGILMFEIAKQLLQAEKKIRFAGMIDTDLNKILSLQDSKKAGEVLLEMTKSIATILELSVKLKINNKDTNVTSQIEDLFAQLQQACKEEYGNTLQYKNKQTTLETAKQNLLISSKYTPSGEINNITIFSASNTPHENTLLGWKAYAKEHQLIPIKGDHFNILQNEENISDLAFELTKSMLHAEYLSAQGKIAKTMELFDQLIVTQYYTLLKLKDADSLGKSGIHAMEEFSKIPEVLNNLNSMFQNTQPQHTENQDRQHTLKVK